MPSTRYTRIEITPDVYRALEAEAILQGKTLKKLASELIMRGICRKALDFIKEAAAVTSESDIELDEERAKVVKKIGATGIYISDQTLVTVREALLDSGYQGAMLHVAQHMASMERDELHRVLAICRRYKLLPQLAAEIVKNLNLIETGRIR